jgi:predicted PurR-regulated permease PerM
MGRTIRLHPAVILVAVAAGTVLAGVAGAIVAVPTVAVTYRVITTLMGATGLAVGQARCL